MSLEDIVSAGQFHSIKAALKAAIDLDHHGTFFGEQKINSIAAHEPQLRYNLFCHLPYAALRESEGRDVPAVPEPFRPGPGEADELLVDGNGTRGATIPNDRDTSGTANDQFLGDQVILYALMHAFSRALMHFKL